MLGVSLYPEGGALENLVAGTTKAQLIGEGTEWSARKEHTEFPMFTTMEKFPPRCLSCTIATIGSA